MTKNKKALILLILLAVCLILCGSIYLNIRNSKNNSSSLSIFPVASDHIDMTDYYHDYKEVGGAVALITDKSSIADKGFNEDAYKGIRIYAQAAGISYSFYSAKSDTEAAYLNAVNTAIKNNAGLIVCAGSHFSKAVGAVQDSHPDIDFLLLDSVPSDESGNEAPIAENVHCITYHEEQAGYLAGYMATLEGFTSLGFIGGEELPSVTRYGYGFLQGIDDAADAFGLDEEINVKYWYSGTFNPDKEIEDTASEWYASGTEVIFVCGGNIYESVLAAAEEYDSRLIGVDVDQSSISDRFLTSAMKGVQNSVILALDEYHAAGGIWPKELAGKSEAYGTNDACIELPVSKEAWRFQNITVEDYLNIYTLMKQEKLSVSDDISVMPDVDIHVDYWNYRH